MVALHQSLDRRIAAVRAFNRFYTQRIGVLEDGYGGGPFSLTEARVLYEIRQRAGVTATEVGRELGLDAGYLSRMLRRFHKAGLIRKQISPNDGRQSLLSLTERGRKAFAPLEAHSNRRIGAMLGRLSAGEQGRLVSALSTAKGLLSEQASTTPAAILREPKARRPRLDRRAPRRAVRTGIRLGRGIRRPVRADRRRLRQELRSAAASAAGSPNATAKTSARCFWSRMRKAWRGCACCWSSPRRAGSASARA